MCTNCGLNLRTGICQKTSERVSSEKFWHRLAPAVLVVLLIAAVVQAQLTGIQFLFFFVLLWFGGVATTIGAELHDLEKGRTFVLCLVAWELLGLTRYVYGVSIGMQTFELMGIMMFVGPVLAIAFTFGKSDRSTGGSWLGSSSCGGGGGGCG